MNAHTVWNLIYLTHHAVDGGLTPVLREHLNEVLNMPPAMEVPDPIKDALTKAALAAGVKHPVLGNTRGSGGQMRPANPRTGRTGGFDC